MQLSETETIVPRVMWRESTLSTNDDMLELLRVNPDLDEFSTVVTDQQTSGRGRRGRVWSAPAGKCLAISTIVRARGANDAVGWIPLIAGLAVARAVDAELARADVRGTEVGIKWPNDVRVEGRKISGILCERTPDGDVIVGTGLNLSLQENELPVSTATSLLIAGVEQPNVDRVLAVYLRALRELHTNFRQAGFDAIGSGVSEAISARMDTLSSLVRVALPGDRELRGIAVALDSLGQLLVDDGERHHVVGAGDVTHVRY